MSNVVDLAPHMPGPTEKEESVPLDTQSWKPEVIADSTGQWCANALRFATEDEAMRNARDLSNRWFAVVKYRAAPSDEPVNYVYTADGKLEPLT